MTEHGPIEIGSVESTEEIPEVRDDYGRKIVKDDTGFFEVQVKLNTCPSEEWVQLFYNPSSWVTYPYYKDFKIQGDMVVFRAEKDRFDDFIRQLKDYIAQANAAWEQLKEEKRRREAEEHKRSQEQDSREEDARKSLDDLLKGQE